MFNLKKKKKKEKEVTLEDALMFASNGFYLTAKNGRIINVSGRVKDGRK